MDEWCGSDGDIFSQAFTSLDLGPTVGTRTWGGVVGISPQVRLADGTLTTQPEFAFWFKNAGWGVENRGVTPSHEVVLTPEDRCRCRSSAGNRHRPLAPERLEAQHRAAAPPLRRQGRR